MCLGRRVKGKTQKRCDSMKRFDNGDDDDTIEKRK